MKTSPFIERAIYGLLIVLSLVAIWLVLNAPANFLNARVVYQGF
jgi:hypothetical protein